MRDPEFLKGKTVVLTGAAGGIGKAFCDKLASYGMNLALVGRKEEALRELCRRYENCRTLILCGDLCDREFTDSIIERTAEEFGGVDVLINCAGLAAHSSLEETEPDYYDRVMEINARAPYRLCGLALPYLRKSDCATIINMCSVIAHKGYVMQSAYVASKHALLGMSKSLANEVFKEDIRVHVISPGAVYTDMVALARPDLTPDIMTLPEDVAEYVGFLLEMRKANAVVDEIQIHRNGKEPFA